MMFTGNKQFDFQIQRFTSLYIEDEEVQRDRKEIGSQIEKATLFCTKFIKCFC